MSKYLNRSWALLLLLILCITRSYQGQDIKIYVAAAFIVIAMLDLKGDS